VLERDRDRLARTGDRLRAAPRLGLERDRVRLERTHERLRSAPGLTVERKRAGLESTAAKLSALSPMQTLRRGYAIVRTDSHLVTSSSDVAPGVRVDVTLSEGAFGARVEEVTP
jgi:exodeoxyribonuclease VII large subunit